MRITYFIHTLPNDNYVYALTTFIEGHVAYLKKITMTLMTSALCTLFSFNKQLAFAEWSFEYK